MKVKVIDASEKPLELLTKATLVSYWDDWSLENLDKLSEVDAEMHIPRVLNYGHESILEHIKVTWAVEGVSIVTLKQITRHRHASFTVRSQRYIGSSDEGFIIPDSIKERGWNNLVESKILEMFSLYDDLVRAGVPKEDARFVLPQAVETKFVVTMNLREFKHFAELRMCERAQWEIRQLAWKMWESLWSLNDDWKKLLVWAKIGPKCINLGYCNEGELMPNRCWLRQKKWWDNIKEEVG